MNFLKIENVIQSNGDADYKTLDINMIRQPYYNFDTNVCVLQYELPYASHEEVTEITVEEYESYNDVVETISLEERLKNVEQTLDSILLGGM